MDYNFNDVEKFLRNGGKPEEIANAFADRLNLAIATLDAQSKLNEKSAALVTAWNEFADEYFKHKDMPKDTTIKDWYITDGEVTKLFDMLVSVLPTFDKYRNTVKSFVDNVKKNTTSSNKIVSPNSNSSIKGSTFEDIMKDFFDNIGL